MQPSFDNLTFLLGDAAQLAALERFRPRAPFDDETLTFFKRIFPEAAGRPARARLQRCGEPRVLVSSGVA
ncbi:hypothetical protein QBS70_03240 [Cronobacter sakazakii]|nr:hypothetical protein [Cronobacter sakazakii]